MENEQNNQMEYQESKHNSIFWIIISAVLFVVVIILVGAMIYSYQQGAQVAVAPEINNDSMEGVMDDMMDDMEEGMDEMMDFDDEDEEAWTKYSSRGIIFEYPESWHIYGQFWYDTPEGEVPDFDVFVSESPVQSVSPRGGGRLTSLQIASFAPGDAFLARYEEVDWASYEQDTIMIGNREVTRLQLEASPEMAYAPQFQEILFFIGDEIAYEVSYSYLEDEDISDWERIRDSLRFTDNVSAGAQEVE